MANTSFKVENGLTVTGANSVFDNPVKVNANTTIDADLLLVTGNFTVQGDYIITGTTTYDTDLIPLSAGRTLGNTTQRWANSYVDISTVYSTLLPNANGIPFGSITKRWEAYTTTINASGAVTISNTASIGNTSVGGFINATGTGQFGGNVTITGFVNATTTGQFGGNLTTSGNFSASGTSTLTGNVTSSGNVTSKGLILDHAAFFANTKSVTTTSPTVIDTFPRSYANFCKLIVSVKSGTNVQATEILLMHEDTNVIVTKYADLYNTQMGSVDAVVNGANVDITFTALSTGTYTVKTLRQMIRA